MNAYKTRPELRIFYMLNGRRLIESSCERAAMKASGGHSVGGFVCESSLLIALVHISVI